MKRLLLVVTAVLVLALSIISCAQTQAPAPPPDIPRYTADQVIAVAKAGAINPLTPWQRERMDIL